MICCHLAILSCNGQDILRRAQKGRVQNRLMVVLPFQWGWESGKYSVVTSYSEGGLIGFRVLSYFPSCLS